MKSSQHPEKYPASSNAFLPNSQILAANFGKSEMDVAMWCYEWIELEGWDGMGISGWYKVKSNLQC